jgi:hypothetical protein
MPHVENYPTIPHENAGAEDCWGCLVPKVDGDQVKLVCNECRAVAATITKEQFEAGYVPEELRFREVATVKGTLWERIWQRRQPAPP